MPLACWYTLIQPPPPLFYKYLMDKERLKLIVKNLKLLVDSLESEVYSDVDAYTSELPAFSAPLNDYEEIFDDDDGYPD